MDCNSAHIYGMIAVKMYGIVIFKYHIYCDAVLVYTYKVNVPIIM